MKLTKFQHACFAFEKDGSTIVVDPGAFTHDFVMPAYVSAVIVTHSHPDHCNAELIEAIFTQNPTAELLAADDVIEQFPNLRSQVISAASTIVIDDIMISFYGGVHADILPGIQTPTNFGVLLDNTVYFPGDSFVAPSVPVEYLALPVSAPWLKLSESAAFVQTVKPAVVFPTHDGILSDEGKGIVDRIIGGICEPLNIQYLRLDGKSAEF